MCNSDAFVYSFWYDKTGSVDRVSINEVLCIASYIANNNKFILYTYNPKDPYMLFLRDCISYVDNSKLFEIRDANEIINKREMFFDTGAGGGIAAFSDYFRYSLLCKFGGWWVDMDTICLRDFSVIRDNIVFASERKLYSSGIQAATCVIKSNKDSEVMNSINFIAKNKIDSYFSNRNTKIDKIPWGVIGPVFLSEFINLNNLQSHVAGPNVFCEIDWFCIEKFISPYAIVDFSNAYCLHMWNAMWERNGLPKNHTYPKGSIIEYFKERYLPKDVISKFQNIEIDFHSIIDMKFRNK
ncbi:MULTISPECIES: glycosyltransferase [Helicobacter]|uniref:Glycosyltransferase n=1 Tax=Helicobacter ibis TaxID=2962633 RepID=A0ABT4VDK4_9HELI|nr:MULTISPECIES: glycosyltransferase [Helicobacter]MDA3966609.1 glycosyltransferase [Helicobacter sp. WB40]MDA3968775.1 glycosyltransferase [Helicobacter ibis]